MTAFPSFNAGTEPTAAQWQTFLPVGTVKTSAENRSSSTTLTSDAVLRADYQTNATYVIQGLIVHNSNSTADFKFQIADSGSVTSLRLSVLAIPQGGSALTIQEGTNGTVFTGEGASADRAMWISGSCVVGATSGALIVQWAQRVSDPSSTAVAAGSYFIMRQVA